jgi:hypothetical protein
MHIRLETKEEYLPNIVDSIFNDKYYITNRRSNMKGMVPDTYA